MLKRTTALRLALMALLMAALACNAVTNAIGGNAANAAEATAAAVQTEAAQQFGDPQATADALSTQAAGLFEDLETPEGEEPEVEDEATDEPGDIPGSGDAPDDIPVFDGNNVNFFATNDVVSYQTDGSYADVVAFYRAEMEANGWTYNATLSTEFGEIAALTYEKDGRTATVSVLTDSSAGNTIVAVTLLQP